MDAAYEAMRDAAEWLDREALLDAEVRKLSNKIRRLFARQERLLAQKLAERLALRIQESALALEAARPEDYEVTLDAVLEETEDELAAPFVRHAAAAMVAGGEQVFEQIELSYLFTFNRNNEDVLLYLQQRAARLVSQVSDTTRRRIRRAIVKTLEDGKGIGDVAKVIRERFRGMRLRKPQKHIRDRAHLIAVTELGNAFEQGGAMAAGHLERGGIRIEKAWTDTGDERVTPGCRSNSAAGWIENGKPFPSGHMHPLRFPGCRCAVRRRTSQNQNR